MSVGLWIAPEPLVLASGSAARRHLLDSAGIPLRVCPADVDERVLEASVGPAAGAPEVALALARAKALSVSRASRDSLVLGSDQVLSLDGKLLHKPASPAAARVQLLALSGRTHRLVSAAVLVRDERLLHEGLDEAVLTMRVLTEGFIDRFLEAAGARAWASVGSYQVEALGIHLFERIEGDHATILGLPLLAVLAGLRLLGVLAG